MRCIITKGKVSGEVFIPPSKSETIRAIVFAAMASGVSTIENILLSSDTFAVIEGVEAFGAKVEQEGTFLKINGVAGKPKLPNKIIDVKNSGLALRFLMGFAALVEGKVQITGDDSIKERRPIKPLLDVYAKNKMKVSSFAESKEGVLTIEGPIKPGSFLIDGTDSQPVSSLLFSTSFLDKGSEITVKDPGEKPWIDLTLYFLNLVGAKIHRKDYEFFKIGGRLSYNGFNMKIGGDFSTALFPIAAALITNGEMKIHGLDINTKQGDIKALDIFRAMGASISFNKEGVLKAYALGSLSGVEVDINDCIDVLPILSVLACFATTKTVIKGADIARYKESNRIFVMQEQLLKMGAKVKETEDGLMIFPSKLKGAFLSGEKDHRVALSLMVAAAGTKGPSFLEGVEVLAKSYPTAIYDFLKCGMNLKLEI